MGKTAYEIESEKAAFRSWLNTGGDNAEELNYTKAAMKRAIREELTEKQRAYMMAYYGGMTMRQVAEEYGVNIGTVSRTIAKARDRLRRVLRYCSPVLLRSTMEGQHDE